VLLAGSVSGRQRSPVIEEPGDIVGQIANTSQIGCGTVCFGTCIRFPNMRKFGCHNVSSQAVISALCVPILSFAVCPVLLVLCERYLWRDRRVAVIRR
jgi:hypothetical protein